ncbi:MAG: metallophosphoesterase [Clostridia bacterium]|nr:metallophosphoesterase [Clostridia bacterium]
MKKVLAIILATLVLISAFAIGTSADTVKKLTREEWDVLYNSLKDDNTLPMLCVGADQTQLGLVWHAPKDSAKAEVRLAKSENMADYVTFTGVTDPADNDTQVVCRVDITGIEENTTYFYQWYTGTEWSDAYEYKSKSFDSYKMMVIGDIQIGGQTDSAEKQSEDGYTWNSVLTEAMSKNPDISFLLSPGDNTSTGNGDNEWQTLLMPSLVRSLPMALAIGNHDKKGMKYDYFTHMPNEYYGKYFTGLDRDFYFRYGDVLYLVFDATSASAADHMAMAKQAVSEHKDAKWRIAVMHQALFGPGYGNIDPETGILLNAVFTPIFDSYDVDLVLTGHSHLQGRSHFMYESSIVGKAESGVAYANPKGTIYLNSNAVCDHDSFTLPLPHVAYEFAENDVTTYTTIEFYGDTMNVKTFRGDNSELLDEISILKNDEEKKEDSVLNIIHRFFYKFVELCGRLYQEIDAIVVANRGGHF